MKFTRKPEEAPSLWRTVSTDDGAAGWTPPRKALPALFVQPEPVEADLIDEELDEDEQLPGLDADEQLPADDVDEPDEAADESLALELYGDDEIVDGEIVDDPVYRRALPTRSPVPLWVTDQHERQVALEWATGYAAYQAKYYAWRSPKIGALLLVYPFRGLYRATRVWGSWAFDQETKPMIGKASANGAGAEFLALRRERKGTVKSRLQWSGGIAASAVIAAGTAAAAWDVAPYAYALAVIGLTVLGWLGRSKDKAIVARAVVSSSTPQRLEASVVSRALGSIGLQKINAALKPGGEGIAFLCDPYRDGPGWRVDIDLPYGVTANEVVARKRKLASGLRRNSGCVWPEWDSDEHDGRLILWVGDKPLRELKMPAWPLMTEGTSDVFKALPFGVDVRGRPVNLNLAYQNLLIGAMPRQGKTFCLRILLLALAFDVSVQMRIFELKGTGDLGPLKRIAHSYVSGISDKAIATTLQGMRDLDAELIVRSELINEIAEKYPELCPENKVTRAIVDDPRYARLLKPVVFAIDEAQNLFAHGLYGDEAAELAERIIKVGPALGIMLLLATQKPNAKSCPTGVTSNVTLRGGLRMADQSTNDMLFGTGAYRTGLDATQFTKKDLGIMLLAGETDEAQTVRTFYVDNPQAHRVIDRAYALRNEAHVLTGVAAGEVEALEQVESVIDHALSVFRPEETELWNLTILERMAQQWPETYEEWSASDLGNAFNAHGVKRRQLDRVDAASGARRNLRGVDRQALQDLMSVAA